MDLITGKALKSFNEWLFKTHGLYLYNVFNQTLLHAIAIDWLDSIGIYILPQLWEITMKWNYRISDYYTSDFEYPTRHQATQQAIKKAIQIYNERN